MTLSFRCFLTCLIALFTVLVAPLAAGQTKTSGASTLIEAGSMRLLFDCGRGATLRLAQMGVSLGSINRVFLTHPRSDHVVPDLLLSRVRQRIAKTELPFQSTLASAAPRAAKGTRQIVRRQRT